MKLDHSRMQSEHIALRLLKMCAAIAISFGAVLYFLEFISEGKVRGYPMVGGVIFGLAMTLTLGFLHRTYTSRLPFISVPLSFLF